VKRRIVYVLLGMATIGTFSLGAPIRASAQSTSCSAIQGALEYYLQGDIVANWDRIVGAINEYHSIGCGREDGRLIA
jgi:hypothetical protein